MGSIPEMPVPRMPDGFNESDFNFSKLYKCVNKIGQDVLYNISFDMYSHESIDSDGGTMPMLDYLVKRKNLSQREIKAKFNSQQKQLLELKPVELNSDCAGFDISLSHLVITEVCSNLYEKVEPECKKSILELKTVRNQICHQYRYGIKESVLKTEIDNLKCILENIYCGVGTTMKKDYSSNINETKRNLQDVLEAKVRQDDLESYLKDVRAFRKDLKFMMINNSNEEVEEYYSHLQILNPCTWMAEEQIKKTSLSKYRIDKIFTPLKVENRKKEIDMAKILIQTKRISGEHTVPVGLLLHGLAGCGKTSLSHFLIHQWCKKDDSDIVSLKDFDLLIFVEIRKVRAKTIEQFLREDLLKETCTNFKEEDIVPTLQDIRVLFVIDGFDEARKDNSKELVKDIFCKFKDSRIFLTTRPEFLEDAEHIARQYKVNCLSIEICGFDEERLKQFSEKVFHAIEPNESRCSKQTKDFIKYIEGPGKVLDDHLKLPLTLALLIYLWKDDPTVISRVTTATQLYRELFRYCQKKLKERLEFSQRHKLEEILDELLFCLGNQAWSLLCEGNIPCITDKVLKKLKTECNKKKVDEVQLLSAYLCCDTEENSDERNRRYAFLHRTQMEYLAGTYMANSIHKKTSHFTVFDDQVNDTESRWRYHQEVIKFMAGHMAIEGFLKQNDNIEQLFDLLEKADIESTNFLYWWNFYLETLKSADIANVLGSKILPKFHWHMDDNQVVPAFKLYYNIPMSLNSMKIDIPLDVDPFDIKGFIDILKDIQMKRKKEPKNTRIKPIEFELHFNNHEEYYGSRSSDLFINALYPWGHLVNFTGCLGEKKEVLHCSFKLKNIRVRLDTLEALKQFKESLCKIHKSIRILRLSIGLPFDCSSSEVCDLGFKKKLELTFRGIKDENAEWLYDVINNLNVGNGCEVLYLLNTQLSYQTLSHYILRKFKNVVREKFVIETNHCISDDEKEKLNSMAAKSFLHFEIR